MTILAEAHTGDSATPDTSGVPRGARMQLYSVVAAGSAATLAALLASAGSVWMLPPALALVYLTIKAYRIYRDQVRADQRQNEEMTRLHREAISALETARQSEQRYARAARHDDLTALPNRRLFSELLQRSMARAARAPEPRYAVLFVDLDG